MVTVCWSDPLRLSESWWNHEIWEVCSASRREAQKAAVPVAGIGQQKRPDSSLWQCPTACHTTCASSWMNWATKFCFICHIHLAFCQPTTISWSIYLCNFLQGKCFHNKPEAKSVFHEFVKSQSMDFYATRINQLIPCWQKCFDCSGSYFD